MTELRGTQNALDPYGGTGSIQCLKQVADLLQKHYTPLRMRFRDGDQAFESVHSTESRSGICAVRSQLLDEGVLAVQLECARVPGELRVSVGTLFNQLAELGDKCRVVSAPSAPQDGETGLWLEIRVAAAPLSFSREAVFVAQLENLDKLARTIQSELPRLPSEKDLTKLYEKFSEHLEPVHPWQGTLADLPPALADWAGETLEFIEGSASVALECAFPVVTQFLLAVLARAAADFGKTLGAVTPTAVNARGLGEIAKKAPGIVTVPAIRISLGTSAYEMANEITCMLTTLSVAGTPVLFSGTHEQLQGVFGGGQGGGNDPLLPVLRHAPEVDLATLALFAIQSAGRLAGGLSPSSEKDMLRKTMEALKGFHGATQRRVLQAVASRTVAAASKGRKAVALSTSKYAATVAALKETLAGLSPRPRPLRNEEVQNRYTAVLTDRGLLAYFGEHLLAQDAALEQLVSRLTMECLTRPSYQPVRYCAQGTPGTGKSESAILLARKLDVPYINIDAASMPDYYTAAAQLLGSGRGIVGSYQTGRLEQAAKCHSGAVVEVSDLDHAVPSVRAALADLFLQVLETGEGQSAAGGMFACSNLIFAFTMNLPDGMDEAVRKRIGFNDSVSRCQLTADVAAHIKRMLSGAFLSRVGTPIVFDPLDGAALALIVERAVKAAVLSAAFHLHAGIADVVLEAGLGVRAVKLLESKIVSSGARALLEHGRCLAARAFLDFQQRTPDLSRRVLRVFFDPDGNMRIALE
ncbi:MAG: AAA family ATPase [bacterium]